MGRPRDGHKASWQMMASAPLYTSCPSRLDLGVQWLFLIGVSPFKGRTRGRLQPCSGARFPCLQQSCDFRAWSGVQMLGERPGGCPLRVVSQVRVAAGGDGWARPVLPTLPQYSPQLRKLDAAQPAARGMEFQRLTDPSPSKVTGPLGILRFPPARCDLPLEFPAPYGGQMWSWVGMKSA